MLETKKELLLGFNGKMSIYDKQNLKKINDVKTKSIVYSMI